MDISKIKTAADLVQRAVELAASDVHIEPIGDEAQVRLRIDGVLYNAGKLTVNQCISLVTQFKVLAGMDIAEKRLPQDGRWQFKKATVTIDLRLSTLPTAFGEKLVIRILDRERALLPLSALAFSTENLRLYNALWQAAYGLVLVTGPTGSGKTTTLYATLSALDWQSKNIITLEEPVEYALSGINQVLLNRKAGLDFARGLRAVLRQDPDVIMVGEIRDLETAELAVRAALTGHLVLATLHTNDAISSLVRLADMGVADYFLLGALRGVVSQRLVRRLCLHCRQIAAATAIEQEYLGVDASVQVYHRKGCQHCRYSGYVGRIAVQEVLPLNEDLARLILSGSSTTVVEDMACALGWRSLGKDAKQKVLQGLTDVSELWRCGIL